MSTLRILTVALALVACKKEPVRPEARPESAPAPAAIVDPDQARGVFAPLPKRFGSTDPSTDAKIALGRMLYYEPRLSKNHDLSCNSCHDLAGAGVDNQPFSKGHKGQLGERNSPTVFNAAGQIAQFWDGRAADVEEQAKGPVLNPVEMGMPDDRYVIRVLASMPGYVDAFANAFPDDPAPLRYDNVGRAIGAFERGLVTPSRFDAFLAGDAAALTTDEQRGLATFLSSGCIACHNGALVGGGAYQKVGLVAPYPTKDEGRFEVTKNAADRFVFKVPMLRNVTRTAPYFHDGAIPDLPTAVRTMAAIQLGKTLTNEEVAAIVTFLGTLEGRPDPAYIAQPTLPPSGDATPPPDPT
jgi:cytochrome c peroxidase